MPTKLQIPETGAILVYLPPPPNPRMRMLLAESLRGLTTATTWLLADSGWAELDALRDQYAGEDKAYAEALRSAARAGSRVPEDERTPPEQRSRELAALEERLWAQLEAFGEVADSVVELARTREDDWLGDLRQRLEPVREARRQAEARLAEAKAVEWRVHKLGAYVQSLSDDGPLSRQPAPNLEPPPARFSSELLRDSLTRPWHRERPSPKVAA
jgi:hypothetical protein